MGRSRRSDHLTFGLDQHRSLLVAGLAVAVVDVALADEEEEAQLDLACASGLGDG